MTYVLGPRSLIQLAGVNPDLVRVVQRAIARSMQDFSVHEGLRSKAQQAKNVAAGVSRTQASRHLTGHAVDLVPWIGGVLRWEWPAIYPIAAAMREASIGERVPIRWGGVWDRKLSELGRSPDELKAAVAAYAARHPGPDLLDGPHFELSKGDYP